MSKIPLSVKKKIKSEKHGVYTKTTLKSVFKRNYAILYFCIFLTKYFLLLCLSWGLDAVQCEAHDLVTRLGRHLGRDPGLVVLRGQLAHLHHSTGGLERLPTSPPITVRPRSPRRNWNSSLLRIPPASINPAPGHSPAYHMVRNAINRYQNSLEKQCFQA